MLLHVVPVLMTVAGLSAAPALTIHAIDFSNCGNALDDVGSAAEDAAGKARDAESAEDEFQSEKDDYDSCRRFPDVYDLLQDGCRSKRRDAKNAQDALESAISDLRSALDDLDSAMSDVQSACGYSFVPAAPVSGVSPARQGICTKVRRLKTTMKPQELAGLCKRVMTETECSACLTSP